MHDALGHTMVGLTIQLEAANRLLTRDTERAQAHLQQALELAKAATLEVRHAVRALRPPELIRGQLTFAVARLVDDFQALTGVNVELIVGSGGYELSDASEIAIYRGVQEALTNAHNHGQATRVVVHLKSGARGVAVRIKDDGRGTDGILSEMAGLGLEGIRHRVRDAGGIVRFRSRLQAGFVVLMVLPRGGGGLARVVVGTKPQV
jgi:signal transduction histidine kinase